MHPIVQGDTVEKGFRLATGPGMELIELPAFRGFFNLVKVLPKWIYITYKAARQADIWLSHGPNIPTILILPWLRLYKVPYALEIRGEQGMDITYLKSRGTRFAWLVACIVRATFWLLRSKPLAVLSVSKYMLDKYPPRRSCPTVIASNSRLSSDYFCGPRTFKRDELRTIISVARLGPEKDHEGTIKACAAVEKRGFKDWRLVIVGDGPLKPKLDRLIKELGLTDKVELTGFIPWGTKLFERLKQADLFVINTFCEGMPRSVIEAMAMALPIIGTSVGGIPEVLDVDDVVPPRRPDILSQKIYEILNDPQRMTRMSKRNAEKAKEYSAEVLSNRKIEFYKLLHELIERHKSQSNS
jgi:glycosyltransferase involved in cell wall biosynthesis